MGRFTDQVRDAIANSGVSRYLLANQVGVSEAALSRFMNGKSGLTLTSLDKLAGVLGLEIVSTVQTTKRPSPRGRRPKTETKAMIARATNKRGWMELAEACAKDAHENQFESRRGAYFIEDNGVVCLYNNNPYADDPARRDREAAEFRRRMKALGIRELACATYPAEGDESAGYSYAMILKATERHVATIADAMSMVLRNQREATPTA